MDGVPTDDDLIYTQLGLLILEEYGLDFSVDDVGAAWVKYLPFSPAKAVLDNLQSGLPAMQAGEIDNPTMFWIGADIRADPWAYAAPGYPELAAEFLLAQRLCQQSALWHLWRDVLLRCHLGRLRPG